MKKILPVLPLFLLAILPACKVAKYTPDKLPIRQIVFGDGGGFAGIETTYTLLENGQLFKQVGVEGSFTELKPIKPKAAKVLFDKVNSLQLFKLDIDQPGNMYYFLRQVTDHLDSRVNWGAGDYLPPQSLVSVYKELKDLAKDREAAKLKKAAKATTPGQPKKTDVKPTDDTKKW
ncbi:MAG: hypothetical protein K9J37_20240 [Saprospiraceae bacterium]|nr:hypothetical protein [Saprospiraceae bacterium]MCF8252258.1 hypothetical protein [Saprospiraceae bacterium]MCF8283087.1 hypothetical protein [Bacteroidales bacterium]MCF8313913.1 hypothetical protein [Saprospiraceae bacterium]MCF8443250.1 hypothetical protein [Saprospiraceae bacterium]